MYEINIKILFLADILFLGIDLDLDTYSLGRSLIFWGVILD